MGRLDAVDGTQRLDHLLGRHVGAGGLDHLAHAAAEVDPRAVHLAEITRVEPPVGVEDLLARRLVEAGGDTDTAYADLAGASIGNGRAGLIHHLQLDAGMQHVERRRPSLART